MAADKAEDVAIPAAARRGRYVNKRALKNKAINVTFNEKVIVLLWLLHQKGLFDPLYDWWEDHFWEDSPSTKNTRHRINVDHRHVHVHKHHTHEPRHHNYGSHHKRKGTHHDHEHSHFERGSEYHYHLHHVHKDKLKHGRRKSSTVMQKVR